MKDERKDNSTPLVLGELSTEDDLEEAKEGDEAFAGEEVIEEEAGEVGQVMEGISSRYRTVKRGKEMGDAWLVVGTKFLTY